MGYISYFAVDQGNLVSGHSEGTEYTIEIDFEQYAPNRKRKINEPKSLSGKTFTRFHRTDKSASLSTVWQDDVAIHDQMTEFADSIDAGEDFIIDPYGTPASPVMPITVTLKGDVQPVRFKKMERWKYTFSVHL